MNDNNLIIYKNSDGNIIVDAIYKDETLWLTQKGMAKVFDVQVPAISKHLKNIFDEDELNRNSVVSKMEITANDGKNYNTEVYNLDAIIAVGYRVNSKKATEFRIWATKILKEYMTKGFALNDERFIRGNKYDSKYFDELLERIKVIRVSERMSYQKITDLFIATSTDYNPKSEEAYTFFKIVQNKLHYAISGHTAAELIYNRADSNKEHMGLTNWKNSPDGLIYKYDVSIAKNYLNEEELEKLNDLTNIFLVFAEDEAKERHILTMQDWINATDDLLKFRRKKVLNNSGNISHKDAVKKAESEYEKYRIVQDQKYISSMDEFYNKYLEENKHNNKIEVELNLKMGKKEYEMYQDIPLKESGSTNLCKELPYEVFTIFLENQMARKFQRISYFDTPTILYIMYVDDNPVGYIGLRTEINEDWYNWSGNFFYVVRLSERGKGYGTKMLELALDEFRKMGFKEVYSVASENNVASSKVMENNGGILLKIDKNDRKYYKIIL